MIEYYWTNSLMHIFTKAASFIHLFSKCKAWECLW